MPTVHSTGGEHSHGRRRRGRGARIGTSLSEINVVPLVDVMLVLLIIFMVTAPMMQQGLEVNLPQSRRADPVVAQPIYVSYSADFQRTRVVQLDKDEVRVEILHERVRQLLLTRDDKSVFVRADAASTAQDFVDVTDQLKQAGVDKIGFISQPAVRR
jgi:biopolymer transport protein TolR